MGTPYNFGMPMNGQAPRRTTPNLTLPNGGNDATMQGIIRRGAPMGSTGGAMTNPGMMPRQPLPQQAAMPMQMPMPMQPAPQPAMPMRSPMAAVPSGLNHSYDAGLGFGSGLAGRAPVPKGRSGYNLDRIAERQWRQNRNPAMLQSQQWYHLNADNRGGAGMEPGMMAPMPMPQPQMPSGHFEPGRSTGSQVWVRDTPAMPGDGGGMPPMDGGGMQPMPGPPAPQQQQQQQQPQPQQPFSFPMPMLPWDGKGPLPPSTLGGGTGVPPPPPVQRFDVAGPDGKPLAWQGFGPDGKPVPAMHGVYTAPKPAKPATLPKTYLEKGGEAMDPKTGQKTMTPSRHYYFVPHPDTGEPVKKYVQDSASDGTGEVGYNPFAKAKPATPTPPPVPAAAPAAPPPAPAAPQASTQTEQVPNVAYANDMSPEQQLAAAREHYAQTGDDSKIREHFQSNPSQAMQLLNQQTEVLNDMGPLLKQDRNQQKRVQEAETARERWLQSKGANTFSAGAQLEGIPFGKYLGKWSSGWNQLNPSAVAALRDTTTYQPEMNQVLSKADELARKYDAQRESDRMTTKEEDFRRGWKMYKATGKTDMLTDSAKKGGKA